MARLIVVGGGLFGRLAADLAYAHGHNVTVIDRHEPEAGSPAAGCLFKPSWMVGVDWYGQAVSDLRERYGMRDIEFVTVGVRKRVSIQHTPPREILRGPDRTDYDLVSGNVVKVTNTGVSYVPLAETRQKTIQGWVYVAAGFWAAELIPQLDMRARKGMSLLIPIALNNAKLDPWAPYKQSLLFNLQNNLAWFGDGSVIKPENWTEKREEDIIRRAAKLARKPQRSVAKVSTRVRGLRPICGGKEGFFRRLNGRLVVGTGGGKMGTLLGMRFARLLMEEMG